MLEGKVAMKRILFVVCAFISLCAKAQVDYDRFEFDAYKPKPYKPLVYCPKETGAPFLNLPYSEKEIIRTVGELSVFYDLSLSYPEVSKSYSGDLAEYKKLLDKYLQKGDKDKNIGNKKQMKYFREDWTRLDKFFYYQELESERLRKEKAVADSIAYREKFVRDSLVIRDRFVQDSLLARQAYVKDSIESREIFVRDSLYRDGIRKKGGYDYVEFFGPHGVPVRCYRNGKLIDGSTYTSSEGEVLEKEYKNGVLIVERTYDRASNLKSVAYIDENGSKKRAIRYGDDGEPSSLTIWGYYPDGKTKKTASTYYYTGSELSGQPPKGKTYVEEYYSDGEKKEMRYYRAQSEGGKLYKKEIPHFKMTSFGYGGYFETIYYDFDGKYERTETNYY